MSMYLCLCCIILHVHERCRGEQECGLHEDQAAIETFAPCTHRTDSPRVGRISHARRCERTQHLHQTDVLASSRNPRHTKLARLPVGNSLPIGLARCQYWKSHKNGRATTYTRRPAGANLTGLALSARPALHQLISFPSIAEGPHGSAIGERRTARAMQVTIREHIL